MTIKDRKEIKNAIAELETKISVTNQDIETTLEQLAHADSKGKVALAGKYERLSKVLDALEGDRLENTRRLMFFRNFEFAAMLAKKPE